MLSGSFAYSGFTAGFGIDYNPVARLEYENGSLPGTDVVDNISWEPALYYSFPNGFRTGIYVPIYFKKIARSDTRSSEVSSWGIGFIGDYAFEITESGGFLLVTGMEAGYGELTDENEFSRRATGGAWIAGIGGIRNFFTPRFSLELDLRVKWHQFDFPDAPQKSYDFSGTTLRIAICYGFYSVKDRGENA
jgi:hypothetical protein